MLNEEKNNRKRMTAGALLSIFLHALFLLLPGLLLTLNEESLPPSYVNIDFRQLDIEPEEKNEIEDFEEPEEEPVVPEEESPPEIVKEPEEADSLELAEAEKDTVLSEFLTALADADTSELDTLYSETTLDVSIKFSEGWTYLDENAMGKLDAVTFFLPGSREAMPFVHLEVRDKDLFRPQKYAHTQEMRHYTAYFNDPEELEGQYSLSVYMRTETSEDYLLKLTVRGEEAFQRYRPVFYAMLKTFSFNSEIL